MSTPGDQSAGHIKIKVTDLNGHEILFRMKRTTKLKKLMDAYCHLRSFKVSDVVLLFEGRLLLPGQTPDQVGMEDGDEIDMMRHMIGGAPAQRW